MSRIDAESNALLDQDGAGATEVAVIAEGHRALAVRIASARAASRSLDLQYYAWHGDQTGDAVVREVLRAADRGVAVRLLLDDAFAVGDDRRLVSLDTHPNIAVRLFNGTRWRTFGRFGFFLEMLLGSWHLNRRMHNKAWIADGQVAIVGGRNIGDAYFDAAEDFNFRDVDLAMRGEATDLVLREFERYWFSPFSRPAAAVSSAVEAQGGLAALRRSLAARDARPDGGTPREAEDVAAWLQADGIAVPSDAITVFADPPEKVRRGIGARRKARTAGGLSSVVTDVLRKARREALLISPYFVPGAAGLHLLRDLSLSGVTVSVVTNSLAATDVVAVHSGYARYRRALLEAGIALFELKRTGDERASVFGSRGAGLHTKAFVIDGTLIGVGSFNLDPRSARLNTEMAVIIDHAGLGQTVRHEHDRLSQPIRSWRVELQDGRLVWTGSDPRGHRSVTHTEPEADLPRRMLASLIGLLPIESQL